MLKESFENITRDIGQELKDTARRIYTAAFWIWAISIIGELVVIFGEIIYEAGDMDTAEFVANMFLTLIIIVVGMLIEWYIIMGTAHLITINLYAKGEIVHLLKKNSSGNSAKGADMTMVKPKAPVRSQASVSKTEKPETKAPEKAPVVHLDDTWTCSNCGTANAIKYGQCKKCGGFMSSVGVENEEASKEQKQPVLEKNIPAPNSSVSRKQKIQKITEKLFVQEKAAEPVHLDDTWTCSNCGAINAMKYSQCKKCGKFKNS